MAILGFGTKFRRWSGTSWQTIANVVSIDGPTMTRDTVDVTNLDSILGYKEFLGGLRDGGSISLTMQFQRTCFNYLKTDFENSNTVNYEIVLPDTDKTSFEFKGLVTNLGISVAVSDSVKANVTIKISSKVTVNSGTGSGT